MRTIILLFLVILISSQLQAQNVSGSAYSYFGIGDIYNKGFGQQNIVGGTGIANRNPFSLNNLNPASYSSFQRINSITEFGLDISSSYTREGDQVSSNVQMEFPYLAMGFKTGRKTGASFGLRKFSDLSYSITGENSFSGIEGEYNIEYEGNGGLNEVYFGIGREFWNTLSLGVHGSYIFGTLQNEQVILSSQVGYNIGIDDRLFLNTFDYDLGMQLKIPAGKSQVIVGATFSPSVSLNEDRDIQISTIDSNTRITTDTVSVEQIDDVGYKLPTTFGAGISWNLQQKMQLSFDYSSQLWSETGLSGDGYRLTNSERFAFGFEKIPNYREEGWFSKINYGFGVFAQSSYLVLDDEQITSRGVSAGFGFPVRNKALIRFVYEYTNRGQDLGDLYRDNYSKVSISVSLLDIWFRQTRYQ